MPTTYADMVADEILGEIDVIKDDPITTYGSTTDKSYHKLVRYYNITSHSQMEGLHSCPRKMLMKKLVAAGIEEDPTFSSENLHFVFGHAVGAGVQSLWLHNNLEVAAWNCFMGWKAPLDARLDKKRKSSWEALIGVEKFVEIKEALSDEWELMYVTNQRGEYKAGIEINFKIDCHNGYVHYGHIDVLLRNKLNGSIAVLELKTTGLTAPEEALYANSGQAVGYSLVLDAIFPGLSSYEVYYCAYSASSREWAVMPFAKSVQQRAEYIKDLLLDHAMMDKYAELQFWPKRGESCFNYSRRCEFFGSCNTYPEPVQLLRLDPKLEAEPVDFAIDLQQVIDAQKERIK